MYDADSRRGRYFGGRQGARMSVCVKVFGPGAMSDLNLFSAPKRTSADQSELMGSRPSWVPALRPIATRRCAASGTRGTCSPLSGDLPVGQRLGSVERKRYPSISLRVRGDLLCFLKLIWVVQSSLQKYFGFHVPQIISRTFPIPPHRGAYRDRHGRGEGCGGRSSVLRATGSQGGLAKGL